jgi:serpin B
MKTIHLLILTALLFNTACAETKENITMTSAEKPEEAVFEQIVAGNTAFSLNLYGQLKDTDGNLFFSPYSISTALALVYAGAKGQTADQLYKTLCIPEMYRMDIRPDREHAAFGWLLDRLNDPNRSNAYQLSVANALWGQQQFPFAERFINVNQQYYHAGLENVDFIKAAEQARQTINQWVEDKTQDKIKDLMPPGSIDAMTRLVVTNAIYFKGNWAAQFDEEQTADRPFFVAADNTVTVPLMMKKADFNYGETNTLQMVELPYVDNQLSMMVLLPKTNDGIAELEKQLTPENLAEWHEQMRQKEIVVYLPRFETTSKFSLAKVLAAMGMPDAFSGAADFSYMIDSGYDMMGGGARPPHVTVPKLAISDVIHQAYVKVNEEGTEAAAATGVAMRLTAMPAPPPVFRADHPFIFLIKDNTTGSILFLGRITDPTKEQ